MDRAGQLPFGDARGHRQHAGDESLHVAGAAPIEPPFAIFHHKRVRGPFLILDGHHVGMPRQDQTAVAFGAEGGKEIGLVPGLVQRHVASRAEFLEIVRGPGDQVQVAVRRDGWKGDQLAQEFLCAVEQVHVSP